jgi:putative transposase
VVSCPEPGRRAIVQSDAQRQVFLAVLGEITATCGVEVHAYGLMRNHDHLLLHTPHGNLSRAMRHLNGVYTQRYNRLQRTDGPLFRGRFQAILVDADSYLAQLSRYIHLNPAVAHVTNQASRYPWSSYPAYLGLVKAPDWLSLQPTLGLFGQRHACQRYQAFVEHGIDEEIGAFYAKKRLDPILGGEAFRTRMARLHRGKPVDPEIPEAKRITRRPTLEAIVRVTAEHFGVNPEDLFRDGRGNLPRAVAMAVSRSPGGYPLKEIAQVFRVGAYASISVAARRLNKRIREDRVLKRQVEAIKHRLFER